MIKLKRILFEGVSPETFITVMDARGSLRYPLIAEILDVKEFYDMNKEKIDRILQSATEFKFLGAGANGSAFSLGNNQVLKIEKSARRPEEIAAHFAKQRKTGKYLPNIYDYGKLVTDYGSTLSYAILERMETPSGEEKDLLARVLVEIVNNMMKYSKVSDVEKMVKENLLNPKPSSDVDSLTDKNQESSFDVDSLTDKLILKENWLKTLIADMFKLRKMGITDFHIGNIGIRRIGSGAQGFTKPEGYLVFFD